MSRKDQIEITGIECLHFNMEREREEGLFYELTIK